MTEITDRRDETVCAWPVFSYRRDPAVPDFPDHHPIVIYDGSCRLCSGVVRFVLRHDRHAVFRFAAAQSALGTALYRHYGLDSECYATYILLENGRALFKSSAAFGLFSRLGLPWSILNVGGVLPRWFTDFLYDLIARNRFRWFGRRRVCLLLEPRHADRFLG